MYLCLELRFFFKKNCVHVYMSIICMEILWVYRWLFYSWAVEMGEIAVLTRHLYKSYGKGKDKVKVLQDLDMTVARGTM